MSQIVFGAGCFWGVEKCFRKKFGKSLLDISVGYAGGALSNPTYKAVCSGTTNHAEVIRIKYDPAVLSLETLVDFFYRVHDPTTLNRQGNDSGTQYRSAIFYDSDEQKQQVERLTAAAQKHYPSKILTTIERLANFWSGEDYHQDYLTKNPHGCKNLVNSDECPTHFERSWEKIEGKL